MSWITASSLPVTRRQNNLHTSMRDLETYQSFLDQMLMRTSDAYLSSTDLHPCLLVGLQRLALREWGTFLPALLVIYDHPQEVFHGCGFAQGDQKSKLFGIDRADIPLGLR